jgi:Tfp pilus assembly protein PilO
MKERLTPKVIAALAAIAVVAVALIGWFALVSPQLSKASDLDRQISEARMQLAVVKADTHDPAKQKQGSTVMLARAMPPDVAMPQVMRQILGAATRSGVRVDSITPHAVAAAGSGYSAVPMDVIVTGRYFPIQGFLQRLRTQAHVVGDSVEARGRLFAVDTVSLAPGANGLPQLAATIHLNVFTYTGSATSTTDSSTSSPAGAAGGSQ